MAIQVSRLADVHPHAQLGENVHIGPFCVVGPHVSIGANTVLDSHVSVIGHTKIGCNNRFWHGAAIGGEPQDVDYAPGSPTSVKIGDNNVFREGVTVNRGADKEDGCTRIGDGNMLMANSHVAHNCRVYNNTYLVNGVLLGGHVHVQDGAVVSGNSVVHHFSTIGTLAMVSGGCRVPRDIAPFMLAAGSDKPTIKTINVVGMKRAGISDATIEIIRDTYRLFYRRNQLPDAIEEHFLQTLDGEFPPELMTLLTALRATRAGKMGRAREALRTPKRIDQQAAETSPTMLPVPTRTQQTDEEERRAA